MNKDTILTAMRADMIPGGWSGLWFIHKMTFADDRPTSWHGRTVTLPAGTYTWLRRLTDSTLYNNPPGEVIMEDTPFELRTHLGFVMQAHGCVLITGLGLGCVIRGLLANPHVEHVTCIENSPDVLKLVRPYMESARLTIIEDDALSWTAHNKQRFDCAWHDIWTNREEGEPHLDIYHTQMLFNCRNWVERQGAWQFNRNGKQMLIRKQFPWIG